MALVLNHATATVGAGSGIATVTLDTTGATAIYIFAYSVFQPAIPASGFFDSENNTWFQTGNPFATCNGSMGSWRCFNPITSSSHSFRVQGNPSWTTEVIVVALQPTFGGTVYNITRARSNQAAPAKPGSFTATYNNLAMVSGIQVGCSIQSGLTVDSGFTIVDQLLHLAVAVGVQPTPGLVDITWDGIFDASLNPSPTAGLLIESFGIYDGSPPPPPTAGKWEVYEA